MLYTSSKFDYWEVLCNAQFSNFDSYSHRNIHPFDLTLKHIIHPISVRRTHTSFGVWLHHYLDEVLQIVNIFVDRLVHLSDFRSHGCSCPVWSTLELLQRSMEWCGAVLATITRVDNVECCFCAVKNCWALTLWFVVLESCLNVWWLLINIQKRF